MAAHFLASPEALPGWFGKLPGIGDFAHRRLPADFREAWDSWLQEGLMQLRLRHESEWRERYLEGPLWFFVLAPGVADGQAWAGVMMPSVDGVGRYFPFTVAAPLQGTVPAAAEWPALLAWWQCAAQAALQALEQDLDAAAFDALLGTMYGDAEAAADAGGAPAWPVHGQSLWLTQPEAGGAGGPALTAAGLPRGARFDLLFGFDDRIEGSLPEVAR
ncbi:type VI secretion system-associated protein TagF [uncultured Pseudacidovorax sp.]|uniref:type VI secretion system-associated protein TagF n=1 Tax=uncultured Pseudacidovorax sp. TaxID=679313 RepID=UPI0025D49587|nr:type VI secretion system-associated protein TagF [uncultured Pseudacidovorax sp.]